jgi:adenine C2-methylase RlmN of 23S rRNA A2503 and tRNA A37
MKEIKLTQRIHTGDYEYLDIEVRGYGEPAVNIDEMFTALNQCLDRVKYVPHKE